MTGEEIKRPIQAPREKRKKFVYRWGNCPYCDAAKGHPSAWGMSPDGWISLKEEHDKYHK